ncbi:uncharacterized protein [Panulirus ornatus]|uniref:uncharacterized protein isoform X3 n=1 Tax=Panulirus ornatus TaxID=150431 RepID=UPI003A8551FC
MRTMSEGRPNLRDLTRLLAQGRRQGPQGSSPGEGSTTGEPPVQGGDRHGPEGSPSSAESHDGHTCHVNNSPSLGVTGEPAPGTVSQSTESSGGTGSPRSRACASGNLAEFVEEVEFQHNSLLGKMQMLREALARQLPQTDEREDVQKKTFAKWINSQLVKGQHPPVTDLFYDLRDGTRLLALLEVLTSKTYKREKGRMRVHHLNNVSRALSILEEHSVKLVNISNEHIVDGSAKLTLGLVWAIILHWQVQGVLKDVMSDLQQTNLEKTLLAWCRQTTKGYHGVDVRNFTTSWTDGLAFNALIHSHRPQLFDWTVLARKHPYARLENAFRLANEHLNIERLLDPEDVNSQVPDKKSIMMYVMCLFQALPHESFTMESLDVSVQSDSSFSIEGSSEDTLRPATKGRPLSTASIGLSEYQRTLEEVLTWLLGAEDRLAAMPPIADTTDEVKDQFHELEELMLELTSKQGGIGDVLGEGSRLMRDGVMEEEEEEEVRVQMKLLNTRWEELRVKAMDRQSRLHEKLMSLQQKQLESLKKWLTDTEDRIANMSQVGPTTEALREQISAHQSLQQDLENEQSNINSLSNMVVVVDESNSDSTYSTLEDELNALGERWAHICRWAESRWTTLQTLSVHWEHFEQEMEKLRKWMDEKEALLRQVESNPSTEQEHILKHASMLQVLQAEMEVQHRCFDYVQEECSKILSYIPQESPAHENLSLEIETLQDRMDCLVSIIEAQTQRMAASGIDISKVMVPVDGSNDVVSSSTTTISHEGTTVVTKIITTKVTETQVKGSVVKRQKLEGGSQEDFFMALHQLGGWMDSMETQVKPKAMEELSLEQLIQLCQQLENEMEAQKEEYYKVVSLGQSAISETSTIGESSKESEQQVAQVVSRWEALMEMLVEIRTRISYMTQKKKVTTELSDLEVHYQGFLRWFEDVRAVSENEPNAVTLQVEQCKTKTAAMKSHDEQITSLKVSAEALDTKWTQETQSVLQQIETFQSKWEILMQRLLEWNDTLQVKLAQLSPSSLAVPPSPPPESLLKAMEASRRWLESLETALASEYSVSTLPQMQDHLTKFKDLSEKVEMEKGNMAHINETCNKLSQDGHVNLMEDITKLNKQWETTTQALQSRIRNIEKVIDKQKQYNDEVSGLKSWLAEVDIFLQAEEAALGDIETLEAQLEQSNALQDDVATLQNNVNSITTAGKQLIEEGDSELKSIIQGQLEELVNRWNNVTELARTQNKSLKEALARSQKVHGDIDKLNVWLDDFEPKVPSVISTRTPEELSNALQMFTQLREEISTHSDDLRALNNIGDEMLQHDSVVTHEELARQFTQLNGRWTEVVAQVDSKYKLLITAAQQYEDFKKLCSEESEWLDQLQAKLERSSKDAADAEEISEALDELEIFLHSHDESRLEQIRSLAESLVREGGLAESVQETTCSLTSRFDTLNTQASEQQSGLEGSVQEAQAWEREYVSVLDYLAQSDLILNQAIADQIQVDQVQVQAELLTQQDVLKKMQRQVEVYHSQGKTEAALRLEDQITHLQRKYEEIEMKLRVCRKPCDFDTRLNQMNQQLTEISQRVHLVNLASGDPDRIQEQLNQCMGLYQTLSEVKAEVENVIATGRKIVKEGQSSDPDDLTRQLDQLKALYNQLGGAVTEQRGVLERALRHSRKIQKDSSHLEEWLSTTEYELDQHEATVPTKNVQGEVHFAQDEQVAKENEMERFIIGLGEIKGWLESTEYQLANIGKMEPDEQDKLMKGVSLEMQNYKSQIENIRDTAVHLINHGVLFQARIQPELLLINQRWENIYKIMQVTSACEIDSSSLASVSRSSAGQTSGFPTVSPISSPEYVRNRQYSVESSQSFRNVGNLVASTDSGPVVTHMASGMSSSMLDFFSRHNVLIIDPDAKEKETLLQPTIKPSNAQNLEVDLGNKGIDSLGISKYEGPAQSSSPIACLGTEIIQDMGAMRATMEEFAISVTSSSSVSLIETSDVSCHMSTSNKQQLTLKNIHFGNGDNAQGHIPIHGNIAKVEGLISTASVEIEVTPFEVTMELAHEGLPCESENMVRNAVEVPTETTVNALVMQAPSILCRNVEFDIKEEIAAEKIADENDKHNDMINSSEDGSKDSDTTAYHTKVIQAADIESGSVIEVMYQVGEPKERKQIASLPSNQNKVMEDKEKNKENSFCQRNEVVSRIATPPTPTKSFLSSQDVPSAVEENPRISVVTAKVVCSEVTKPAFLKQAENFSNNKSTTLITSENAQLTDSKVWVESSSPSRAIDFAGDEVPDVLDISSPIQSFATESQANFGAQKFNDDVIASENVLLTSAVDSDRKISTASEECDFVPQEVVSTMPSPFSLAETVTFPQEMCDAVELDLKTRAVLTEIVQINDSGCSNSEVIKENFEISTNVLSPRSNNEMSENERKISGAMKSFEIMFQEIPEAFEKETLNVPEFAVERSVSERAIDGLKEAVLVAPEVVFQESPYCNRNVNLVENIETRADHPFDGNDKKMSISSADAELSYTEMLEEKEQTYASEVFAGAHESCSEEVVVTAVSAINSETETRELSSSEVNGQIHMDVEVISEVSEEGIPLGCEAALIDSSVISGYEIKSQSGQGSYSGELAADEINFIRGVKSAIPSGYIFTTNAVEDDRTSEALSYFDIETSVDVQDRYGVAVTVIGTHNDLNMSLEDTEEKQIPYEEGGLEELKMESSIDFLLKSSQHSSKGTSFVDLSGGSEHKDTQKGLHDSSEKNIESKKDKLGNRSTFLTEVANLTENEYSVTFEEQSHANTVQISNQNDILKAEKKYEIDRIMENSDTGLVLPFVSQPFLHKEEKERILDTEQPFRAFQESQKLDGNFDRLQSVPQMNAKRNNNVEGKIVKKAEVSSEKDSEIDLQYVPFLPPANEIDYIVKKEDDSGEKSEIKHAEEACMEDEMTDVHYSPHCPVIKLEDEILGLESCSLADVPEIRTRKEQESKSEEFVHPTVLEHGKVSALQSVDSLHLESLTRGKPSSKSVETAVCYVPHVPPASGKDFHETPADINDIPQVSSDHSTVLLEEISVVPEEQSFANFMKLTTTTGVATPSTETDISTLKDILVEIHDVPIQRNRNISKKIPEEKLDELTEIPSYIRTSKQDVSDICTTVDSKDNEAYEKGDKSSGGGLTATRVQCKSVEAELTKNKGNIMEQGDHENRSKIHYVPYVPKSAAVSSVSPPLSPSTQGQTRKNLIFKKKDLSSIKETNITSDEEVFESAGNDGMETQSKKVQDLGIHYVPCIPSGDQHWDQGGLRKEAELSTYSDKQQFFVGEEKVPEFKTGIIEESVPIKSKSLTSSQKADIIEAQVHIPATEGKNAISGTMKETRVHEERTRSYELQYVPCSPSEFPKSVSGARPKEIHYVPHSPADVKSFECEETNTKPIMSDFIASPFSPKVDVVASPPEIMKNLRQAPTGGSVTDVADLRSSTSETAFALRSFVKESAQEQVQFPTTSVTLVSEDTQRAGQSVLELGDEIDAFLKEVTGMADKISAVKTKVQTVPSHEEAKEKVEAIEQEVALLEPDVATVISRGDTLTLTTHMVDVPRANTIRIAVNDLRTHWSSLKSETEIVKLEAEEVAQEIGSISERADEIISWSNDVLKRLHLVNNDESQLEALENEMTNKKVELDKLNETGALLKKYKYNQIQPALTLLNMRWTEISMQFRQYRKVSLEKKTIVATTQVETETEPVIVPDFVASVNRLREAVSAISRQLHASKLSGNKYDNLKAQEDELKVIKQGLETLKPRVDGLETERNTTIKSVTPAESEQVRRVMDKLREEWAQVNRGYTERHACWLQCSETWRTLQKTIDDFAVWLNSIEEKVQITANQALPDAKSTQKELEKQVTLKHRPSQTLQSMCKEVTEGMSADDGKRLQERVDSLMKRWRALLLDLAARRERIAGEEGGKDSTCSEYETLVTWVDQAQALMDAPVNVTDEASLSAHSTMVQNHLVDMTTKQASLKKLKDSKQKLVSSSQMATLETNLNKVLKTLPEYKSMVDTKLGVIKTLVADVEGLYKWTEEMRVKVALRDLTEEEIKLSKITLREKEALYENLDSTYWVLAQDAEGKGLTVAVALKVSK